MRLRIGTRGSALALAQSRWVAAALERVTGEAPEIVIVSTSGDQEQSAALASWGGAGAFTKEIDVAQRAGRFELSVHSLKDLPTADRDGLVIAAVPERAPVADCLVARDGHGLDDLPPGATVGTGSPRRRAELLRHRPDLEVVGIRGNVDTRLAKVRGGEVDATVLARAGLVRLGLADAVSEIFPMARMLPAAGQGALAIVASEGADEAFAASAGLEHPATRAEVDAERTVLAALGGGCHLPMGVLARVRDDRLRLRARVVATDGSEIIEEEEEGAARDAVALGRRVGERLAAAGAHRLLG